MDMLKLYDAGPRVKNFAIKREDAICMECGRQFLVGKGLYERRFCSEECKIRYLL